DIHSANAGNSRPGTDRVARDVPDTDPADEFSRRGVAKARGSRTPPPALVLLANQFGLSQFERNVLLLCAATELDTRIGPLCACAQDDPAKAYPTFGLAMALFDYPEWSALTPARPLRAMRLIEIHQPATTPLIAAALRADERLVHYLKGLNQIDDRLSGWLGQVEFADNGVELPESQRDLADAVAAAWFSDAACGED